MLDINCLQLFTNKDYLACLCSCISKISVEWFM